MTGIWYGPIPVGWIVFILLVIIGYPFLKSLF